MAGVDRPPGFSPAVIKWIEVKINQCQSLSEALNRRELDLLAVPLEGPKFEWASMKQVRKILTATIAAASFSAGIAAAPTPAAAWCNAWGCYGGVIGGSALAAGAIGGLTLGLMAGTAAAVVGPYGRACWVREPTSIAGVASLAIVAFGGSVEASLAR